MKNNMEKYNAYMNMNTKQPFDLPAIADNRKSYYGKATVFFAGNRAILKSYETDVAEIDESGNFRRLWDGYSATTMRHINSFCALFGIDGGGKKWWDSLEVMAG